MFSGPESLFLTKRLRVKTKNSCSCGEENLGDSFEGSAELAQPCHAWDPMIAVEPKPKTSGEKPGGQVVCSHVRVGEQMPQILRSERTCCAAQVHL